MKICGLSKMEEILRRAEASERADAAAERVRQGLPPKAEASERADERARQGMPPKAAQSPKKKPAAQSAKKKPAPKAKTGAKPKKGSAKPTTPAVASKKLAVHKRPAANRTALWLVTVRQYANDDLESDENKTFDSREEAFARVEKWAATFRENFGCCREPGGGGGGGMAFQYDAVNHWKGVTDESKFMIGLVRDLEHEGSELLDNCWSWDVEHAAMDKETAAEAIKSLCKTHRGYLCSPGPGLVVYRGLEEGGHEIFQQSITVKKF